jgi:hypothetical protein
VEKIEAAVGGNRVYSHPNSGRIWELFSSDVNSQGG